MSSSETDAEVRGIFDALRTRRIVAERVQIAVQSAQIALARAAAHAIVDTVLAGCVAVQAPQCIGTIYGIKIVAGTADFAIQAIQARDGTALTEIVIGYAKNRGTTLLKDLPSDLKPKPVHEAGKRALKLVGSAAVKLAAANATVAEFRHDLENAVSALEAFERAFDGALINEASYREYRRQHFEAQRWLPRLLINDYAATRCALPEGPNVRLR